MNRFVRITLALLFLGAFLVLQYVAEEGKILVLIITLVASPLLLDLVAWLLHKDPPAINWVRSHFFEYGNPAQILLDKVRQSWVQQYLHPIITDHELEIGFDYHSLDRTQDFTAPPVRPIHGADGARSQHGQRTKDDQHDEKQVVRNLLSRSGQRVLITGERGGGKTVMMLKITDWLAEDAAKSLKCIPVVLNLSTWDVHPGSKRNSRTGSKEPFEDWVVRQLRVKYQVEASDARRLLGNNQLVLVLDGLDEVGASSSVDETPGIVDAGASREQPIHAMQRVVDELNLYLAPKVRDDLRTEHQLRYVITCRTSTFDALQRKPLVHGRIHLRRLTREQVLDRVERTERNWELHDALTASPELMRTAENAYHLNVMLHTLVDGSNYTAERIIALHSSHQFEDDLFSSYLLSRASATHSRAWGDVRRLTAWLSNVAYLTRQRGGEEFLVEEIQPSLLRGHWRWVYRGMYLAATTAFVALAVALPVSVGLGLEWNHYADQAEGIRRGKNLFLGSLLILAVGIPLAFGFGSMVDYQPAMISSRWARTRLGRVVSTAWHTRGVRFALLLGLVLGIMRGLVIQQSFGMTMTGAVSNFLFTFVACTFAFVWTTGTGLIHENMDRVNLADARRWTRRRMLIGAVVGLGVGMIFVLAAGVQLLFGSAWEDTRLVLGRAVSFALTLSLCLPVLFGFTGAVTHPSVKTRPNHGIWQMAKNAALSYLVLAGVGFAGLWFGYGAFLPPPNGIVNAILGICFGVLALAFGLLNVIRHVSLRLTLAMAGDLPLNVVGFLRYTSAIGLTRAIGGRFLFEHTSLREFFFRQADALASTKPSALRIPQPQVSSVAAIG